MSKVYSIPVIILVLKNMGLFVGELAHLSSMIENKSLHYRFIINQSDIWAPYNRLKFVHDKLGHGVYMTMIQIF